MIMMNDNGSKNVNEHYCVNCRYTWTSRKSGFVPKECPNCKSRKWKGVEPDVVTSPTSFETKPHDVVSTVNVIGAVITEAIQQNEEDDDAEVPSEFIPDRYHINEG